MVIDYNAVGEYNEYAGGASHDSKELLRFLDTTGFGLDLGSASGRNSTYLRSKGLDVVSVDIAMSQLCRVGDAKNVCADACKLPFKKDVFDFALCSELLEHLTNPLHCVLEAHRVLKSGGLALFTTPCLNLPVKFVIPLYRRIANTGIDSEGHLRVFSDVSLLKLISPPFEVVKIGYTNYTSIIKTRWHKGYKLDRWLTKVTERFNPLHYFSQSVWILARKA